MRGLPYDKATMKEITDNWKRRLRSALIWSFVLHALGVAVIWYYPTVSIALGLRNIEFVDEDYNRAILIDFSKTLPYPPGYIGFHAPNQASAQDPAKAEEERRRRLEAERRAREEAAKRAAEERERAAQQAKNEATPTPTPRPGGYGAFGKINTAPIKDQIFRLYEAKKVGTLVLPEGKLKVGVSGRINSDGSLSDYKVIVSSGNPEIDRAALAILDAVSESRALGPLHQITSLTMILDIDQQAQLSVVGFANSEQAAATVVDLANAAILYARFIKKDDPGAMALINNVRVTRAGQRVQALITMPRQAASDTLAQTMERKS
jgi:hypothetical protein